MNVEELSIKLLAEMSNITVVSLEISTQIASRPDNVNTDYHLCCYLLIAFPYSVISIYLMHCMSGGMFKI